MFRDKLLLLGEHVQMIFYKLGKIFTTNNKFYWFSSHSHKILRFFDSNTILTSFMTSRVVTVIFFPYKGFFLHDFHSLSPTFTKSYAFLIVILSLHLSWLPGSWRLMFFLIKVFFCMNFTSASFIRGAECHRPWHYGGKHTLLNVFWFAKSPIADVRFDLKSE